MKYPVFIFESILLSVAGIFFFSECAPVGHEKKLQVIINILDNLQGVYRAYP